MTTTTTRQPTCASTDASPVWHFDHVNVSTGDGSALSALFEDVMGLQNGYRPPFPFPGQWLYAEGQAVVHAITDASHSQNAGAVTFGHIAFRSDQPAASLIEKLRCSGLSFRVSRVPEDNTAQIFVLLPGNFVVELNVPDDEYLPKDHVYSASQASPGSQLL
ncbi:hypothetical protein RBI14_17265 [Alcaligenaceae bacterium B3P038]|nr:hypothetical protein [Alcaligenaceae bacterium B3P038]